MAFSARRRGHEASESLLPWVVAALVATAVVVTALGAGPARANGAEQPTCSRTASIQYTACRHEVRADFQVARAICLNRADEEERQECWEGAREERGDANSECRAVREARWELCDMLGEDPYDPDFDPALFDDDFDSPTNPNPYFPLDIGNVWVFEGDGETTRIEVLDKTKLVDGVRCIVVNDLVSDEDGRPIEDTDDWFGLRLNGDVDYCGESVRDFEFFEGDDPQEAELIETAGSFKAGRSGDESGTLFPISPSEGDVFRQEWSASNAEDAAIVQSTTYRYPSGTELDEGVPRQLAELFCNEIPCVVLGEFSPMEPGVLERKYFGAGIGKFLEVKVGEDEVTRLVECNFDARCGDL